MLSTSAPRIAEEKLARLLEGKLGAPLSIVAVESQRCPYATLFPADVLVVHLRDRVPVSLFVKHLGNQQADHPDKQRRDREALVYEHLLDETRLPVVRFYGCSRVESNGQTDLFLEYVDALSLKYHALDEWVSAARRLAQLHAFFASSAERLRGADFLLSFDETYYAGWVERAARTLAARSFKLARAFERVAREHERAVHVLASRPVTLVHNDLSPKNVLVETSSGRRVCFIDWELAGIGCGVLDLVHLSYGLERKDEERMREAYCEELLGTNLLPAAAADLDRLFDACALQKIVFRLARSSAWKLPAGPVTSWVAEAHRLIERL